MELTEHHKLSLCLNIFKMIDSMESSHLLILYVNEIVSFHQMKHPKFGISAKNKEASNRMAKEALRWLTDNEYLEMKEKEGKWFSYATQKLHDYDEFPIGFTRKILSIDR